MNYLQGISSIVFDLGGVIVDLNINKTREALARILGLEQPDLYYSHNHIPLFSDYEVGHISSNDFVNGLLQQSINGTTVQAITDAWNAMLLQIPSQRIRMLERLRNNYRLFILSNTNAIHVEKFEKMAEGYNNLSDLFEAVYYSHLIGSRKPDNAAFNAVVINSGIDISSTLFVDDLPANIEAAAAMGFKTLHIQPGMEVADILID